MKQPWQLPIALLVGGLALVAVEPAMSEVRLQDLILDPPVPRAGRPVTLSVLVANPEQAAQELEVELEPPAGLRVLSAPPSRLALEPLGERRLTWRIEAERALRADLRLRCGGASATWPIPFLEPRAVSSADYLPEPQPIATDMLVGAHHCPLWEPDQPRMWDNVLKHPERTPALGYYAQNNPEVADWETKWAVEHGVSFFIYCWYRSSQGRAVTTRYGSAIHDALFKSRFADKLKFTIMWENQSRGVAGVADERDLMENLLPYWLDNYFQHPSYLKIDNKPVLFIYRPEFLVQDLGGVEQVNQAFAKMRAACRAAGFDGLYLLGEYRGLDPGRLTLMKQLGLDYTFAYVWPVPNSPTPQQASDAQMGYIQRTQELGILPQVVTVSQAWSGWRDEGSIWKIPPPEFEHLLRRAKSFCQGLPEGQLGRRMMMLDNWNEWGEGHYIAPYREYGFGYLDAVRRVFGTASAPHEDLLPEDLGRGPYDLPYRAIRERVETLRPLTRAVAHKGPEEQGLLAWWSFDEPPDSPVVLDNSGRRHGAALHSAGRAEGIDGLALVCAGGCAVADSQPALSPAEALTVSCWVRTDLAGQSDKWFLNRLAGGSADRGFRFGLSGGRPGFAVPLTNWSHHLVGPEPLPTGRWVHLAGTFDGRVIRLYVDGLERASVERIGPLKPSQRPICIGSYEAGHAAHFTGLLDEVKLYGRALGAAEVRAQYDEFAAQAATAGR